MTRSNTMRQALLVGLATVLLAVAAVGLVALPSAAAPTTDATTGDALTTVQSTEDVEITVEYRLAPEHEDAVRVDVTIHNPENWDSMYIIPDTSEEDVLYRDGFRFDQGDEHWYVEDGVDEASMAYRALPDSITDGDLTYYSNSSALVGTASLNLRADGRYVSSSGRNVTHDPVEGVVTDGLVCVGECEMGTATAGGTTEITILGDRTAAAAPQAIAERIADVAAEQNKYRPQDRSVLGVYVPELGGVDGKARPGSDTHRVAWDVGLAGTGTWSHEYIHNTDHISNKGLFPQHEDQMKWFTEGYGRFGDTLYRLESGHLGFDEFQSTFETGTDQTVQLSDPSTWEDSNRQYNQGMAVLAALDREIRLATDGERTVEDVIRYLNENDYEGTLDEFTGAVANVSNDDDLAATVESWVHADSEAELPEAWDYDAHVALYGDVPRFSASDRTVGLVQDDGTTEASLEEPVVMTTAETLEVEETIENTGSATGTYWSRIQVDDAENATLDNERATLAPDAEATVTGRLSYDEPGTYTATLAGEQFDVYVVEPEWKFVPYDGEEAVPSDPDDRVAVSPATPAVAFQVPDLATDFTVTNATGDEVHYVDLFGSQNVVELDPGEFEPGATYDVEIESWGNDSTEIIQVIEPVDGVYPRDVNGDGLHRDMNADGSVGQGDVSRFFEYQHRDTMQDYPEAYDFSGNGMVNHGDVVALSDYVALD